MTFNFIVTTESISKNRHFHVSLFQQKLLVDVATVREALPIGTMVDRKATVLAKSTRHE
jgi:hypothetical protein